MALTTHNRHITGVTDGGGSPAPAFQRYSKKCLHDAAWDALATGEVFAKLSRLVPEKEAGNLRGQLHMARRYTCALVLGGCDRGDAMCGSCVRAHESACVRSCVCVRALVPACMPGLCAWAC